MRIQNRSKRGIVSEFLVRIMSILLLITMFIIFSFIVQLSQCGCSDSETVEILDSDSDKTLFLDTAIDNMLNSNITISFCGYIQNDKFSKTPKLSNSSIVFVELDDYDGDLRCNPIYQQSITLPLWKAIAIYADYDKSVFKEESGDFKTELEEAITDYISTALSKINETVTWREYVVIDKKAIIIFGHNGYFGSSTSDEMVIFPSDYNTIYKTRTIPKLSASDPLSSLEIIIQFEK